MINKIILICVFFSMTFFSIFADGISAHLSQRKIALNDSFTITFSSKNPINTAPDFTPLLADFDVINTSQENSLSFINGKASQEIRWNVVLIAKHEGNLTIPSIHFGDLVSAQQAIEVMAAGAIKSDDEIFLETEISPKETVYEQSLLTYTVKLYCSVNMAQATLTELCLNNSDAIVERLGGDVEYDHYNVNGKRYRVYERKYAVSPLHSGELTFPSLIFEGAVISGGNSFFNMQTKLKRLSSEKQSILVQPIPSPFNTTNWFAANEVKLSEEWSIDPEKGVVGEPVTWTIKLDALNCLGNNIPDIALNFSNDLKHYFDKAVTSNQPTPQGIVGKKEMKVALIATKPGQFQLPKVKVQWWDLKSNELRIAELPERFLNIADNQVAMNDASNGIINDVANDDVVLVSKQKTYTFWILFVGGIIFLLGVFVFFKLKKSKNEKPDSLRQIRHQLKKACEAGDGKQAEACLLAWFNQQFPEAKSSNLLSIKLYVSENFQIAITDLYKALYGQNSSWNGDALWEAFLTFKRTKGSKLGQKEKLLPDLYSS